MEQVKLWVTNEDGSVGPLSIRDRIQYEHLFEDMLVQCADMLGDDVTLIARQLTTVSGPLDLLGVDQDGKLVVYELKRGATPREAITQAIDYASWLDSLEFDELARRVSDHQASGIDRGFDDFDDWYTEQFAEDQAEQLRPTRIVVVGLGIEPGAERMAHWLADKGVDIEAITFHAFEHDGRTVLARQVEVSSEDVAPPRNRSAPPRPDPERRAAEFNAAGVYRSAREIVASCFGGSPYTVHTFKNGVNFALPPTDDRKIRRYPAYVGVYVRTEGTGQIHLVIRPAGVAACPDELAKLLETLQRLETRVGLSPSGNEAWITLEEASLEKAGAPISAFVESAVGAWRRDWEHWNAGSGKGDSEDPEIENAPSATVPNMLDGSDP
ncbi:MAG: DUF91 domain-containing protein [Chloroflexi bacterium]|nr:DUF91 domain-containing protein [Chloroflexota bacterium]